MDTAVAHLWAVKELLPARPGTGSFKGTDAPSQDDDPRKQPVYFTDAEIAGTDEHQDTHGTGQPDVQNRHRHTGKDHCGRKERAEFLAAD